MTKEIDFMELMKNRSPLSEKDEGFHDFEKEFGEFPKYHNESWYFNFIDRPNKVYFVARLSIHMDTKKSRILCLLIIDGKRIAYFNEIPLQKLPENLEFDRKLKCYCIEPLKKWRVVFKDARVNLDVTIEGRFPVLDFAEIEDPKSVIEKYGKKLLDVAAQEHYEQPTIATGILELKKRIDKKRQVYATRNIKAFGHRDHSWGIRHWVQIDGWNWVSAQFDDMTINFYRTDLTDISPQIGAIHLKNKEITIIEKIKVKTITKDDGKTPISSTFVLTDKDGNEKIIESKTIYSVHLPLPSEMGMTEIFEQVAVFTCEGKEGDGISEYLISTRK
jgi:hypothetical protein